MKTNGVSFKVQRASVPFTATLSSGKVVELEFLAISHKQIKELGNLNGIIESLKANEKILNENIKGEKGKEFVLDLIENGNTEEFLTSMNDALNAQREAKRKN